MSEREPFVRVQLTFELNLYYGRINKPFKGEDTWLLYFKDQFTDAWLNHKHLRPGEYIIVTDAKVLPSE
jgi:hypothetical protein